MHRLALKPRKVWTGSADVLVGLRILPAGTPALSGKGGNARFELFERSKD
jgi:hypothetical protein